MKYFFEFLDRNLSELQKNLGAHFPISSDASPTSFRPGGVSFWGNFLFSFVRIYSHLLRTAVGEGQVMFELTEGLDSFPNRQNTLNERLVVPFYNDQTKLRLTKADVEITNFTILKGSFYTISVF